MNVGLGADPGLLAVSPQLERERRSLDVSSAMQVSKAVNVGNGKWTGYGVEFHKFHTRDVI